MKPLGPILAHFLTPDKTTLRFAVKGVIAMALALFVSMSLNLERPYWSLVSAIFLQIRSESGMVIEKAICQIGGSVAGGIVALLILNWLMPFPFLALACLTLWIGLNAAASAMVHRLNFIYAFAMAAMTASLVIVLVMADPAHADSAAVFNVAQSRISEISVGAICATLVSLLIWPTRVKDTIRLHAQTVINKTLDYLVVELDPKGSHQARHAHADAILISLIALNDDSSAVVYEGPEGAGRERAANLLCQKVLSLLAVIQIFGRFQRNHPELLSSELIALLAIMREQFQHMADSLNYADCYQLTQKLRRTLLQFRSQHEFSIAIQSRLLHTSIEMVANLIVVIKAYDALENSSNTLLKAPSLSNYRDPLLGAITGVRSMLVFIIGALVWVGSTASGAILMMVLPLTFSVMFARLPSPPAVLKKLLVGVVAGIIVALFFGLGLLAQSSGDFEVLILVLAGPYFIGLMALMNRATLPYGLGFCITFTILVQPNNNMTFAVGTILSSALGIVVGISILYWVFKLITAPNSLLMQRRLIESTARDLAEIGKQVNPENWFNGRMGERLMRLSDYEQGTSTDTRHMTDLGLNGLNLGHLSVGLRRLLSDNQDPLVCTLLETWQQSMAQTFLQSASGQFNSAFEPQCQALLNALKNSQHSQPHLEIITGMFERLVLTFQRTARVIANHHALDKTRLPGDPPAIKRDQHKAYTE